MRIIEILQSIEELLRNYDFIREANSTSAVLQLIAINPDQAYEHMISENWWIGEDAVAEADLSIAGGFSPQARKDQDSFQHLIIELYENLKSLGYESELADIVTSQYHKWLVSRM